MARIAFFQHSYTVVTDDNNPGKLKLQLSTEKEQVASAHGHSDVDTADFADKDLSNKANEVSRANQGTTDMILQFSKLGDEGKITLQYIV